MHHYNSIVMVVRRSADKTALQFIHVGEVQGLIDIPVRNHNHGESVEL